MGFFNIFFCFRVESIQRFRLYIDNAPANIKRRHLQTKSNFQHLANSIRNWMSRQQGKKADTNTHTIALSARKNQAKWYQSILLPVRGCNSIATMQLEQRCHRESTINNNRTKLKQSGKRRQQQQQKMCTRLTNSFRESWSKHAWFLGRIFGWDMPVMDYEMRNFFLYFLQYTKEMGENEKRLEKLHVVF